jgi:hypothetical protein
MGHGIINFGRMAGNLGRDPAVPEKVRFSLADRALLLRSWPCRGGCDLMYESN